VTLPIASVPNLQPKDRLWLHPDLPPTQSVHYLMVLAFLRGTTNPPPDHWFIRIPTWEQKVRKEGIEVTVPDEAQEAVVFLAATVGMPISFLINRLLDVPGPFSQYLFVATAPLANGILLGSLCGGVAQLWSRLRRRSRLNEQGRR
jgi:hypothetical protein